MKQQVLFKNELTKAFSHLASVCEEACCWKYKHPNNRVSSKYFALLELLNITEESWLAG